ncbi:MAG: hypothetical protein V2A61_02800 [Calditrichota bacterium]
MGWIKVIVILGGAWVFNSCDAPRSNPYDPQSPQWRSPPAPEPIIDLRSDSVRAERGRLVWTSPLRGVRYEIYYGGINWDGIDLGSAVRYPGELPAPKPAGQIQSVWVNLPPNQTHTWVINSRSAEGTLSPPSNLISITPPTLDHKAQIGLNAYTSHVAWWGLPDQISFWVNAVVNEPDTTDSVWIQLQDQYLTTLQPDLNRVNWAREIGEIDLQDESLEALIGYNMGLFHRDRAGFVTLDTTFHLIRIINYVPQTESPTSNDTVSQDPTLILKWYDYQASYAYTFAVEIIHMSETYVPTKVYADLLISSDSLSVAVKQRLTNDSGFYLWTVSVVDDFGNRARSREARFCVEDL